jgi:uncharacterized protein (DUF302 family)
MMEKLTYEITSDKPFEEVVANIESQTAAHQFRVLAVHDVQQTLAEKGLHRKPLKIIEVCNATFAHEALSRDVSVAMFMPCKFTVYENDRDETVVSLARPRMISELMPGAGLKDLATEVEETLKKVMAASI